MQGCGGQLWARPGTWRGPECRLLAGVQAAMLGVDVDLSLWRKGAIETLEQEPGVAATWEKTWPRPWQEASLPHLVREFALTKGMDLGR